MSNTIPNIAKRLTVLIHPRNAHTRNGIHLDGFRSGGLTLEITTVSIPGTVRPETGATTYTLRLILRPQRQETLAYIRSFSEMPLFTGLVLAPT